jgi:hypothetical protein
MVLQIKFLATALTLVTIAARIINSFVEFPTFTP